MLHPSPHGWNIVGGGRDALRRGTGVLEGFRYNLMAYRKLARDFKAGKFMAGLATDIGSHS